MRRFVFAGQNPSKAGWPDGDLTVTKCCGFVQRELGMPLEVTTGGAVFSADGLYRYRLWRDLCPRLSANKPLIARVDIINPFAFVSTDPEGLYAAADPVGADNAKHIDQALAGAATLIAAWGALPKKPLWLRAHANTLLRKMTLYGDVYALGTTADGSPLHPSRLPYSFKLQVYRPRQERRSPSERRAGELVREAVEGGFASLEDFT